MKHGWLLANLFNFDGSSLAEAIRRTQENRDSVIPSKMAAFSETYIAERQDAWEAFIEKINAEKSPAGFTEAIEFVRKFLEPVLDAVRRGSELNKTWVAPGPWE